MVGLPGVCLKKRDLDFAYHLIAVAIIEENHINVSHQENLKALELYSLGSLEVFLDHIDSEVMHVLSRVNVKTLFILLVRDGVFFLAANHHLVAPHVVLHYVLELGHESFLVDVVEVNVLVGADLDPLIALDEVNKALDLQVVILLPVIPLVVGVPELLEEKDVG